MPSQIKAAVCNTFGAPLDIETLTIRDPGPGEVAVTLDAVAICHSDISYADGIWGGDLPLVLGHEAAGRVTAVGDGVTGAKVGDKVVVTLIRACGRCAMCLAGKPVLCHSQGQADSVLTRDDGTVVKPAMHCGAFAEKVLVDQSQIVTLPDSFPSAAAALLACGVITGVGAIVNAAQLRAGEDVVVIGAGGVGLNAIQGARIAGARRIVAVDMTEDKLAIAREFGATHGVLATEGKPWRHAIKALGRQADVVAVTVGAIPAYNDATRYLGWGGRLLMVGMPASGAMAEYEPAVSSFMGQSLIGTKMGDVVLSRDIPWMADLYDQGRLKLDELISNTWSLDQINDAIADTRTGSAKRNVISFDA